MREPRVRRRGEIHLWMYDELFLSDVVRELGYDDPRRMTHTTSRIPDWQRYGLDAEPDGSAYKGTSLYLEACRPTGGTLAGDTPAGAPTGAPAVARH